MLEDRIGSLAILQFHIYYHWTFFKCLDEPLTIQFRSLHLIPLGQLIHFPFSRNCSSGQNVLLPFGTIITFVALAPDSSVVVTTDFYDFSTRLLPSFLNFEVYYLSGSTRLFAGTAGCYTYPTLVSETVWFVTSTGVAPVTVAGWMDFTTVF